MIYIPPICHVEGQEIPLFPIFGESSGTGSALWLTHPPTSSWCLHSTALSPGGDFTGISWNNSMLSAVPKPCASLTRTAAGFRPGVRHRGRGVGPVLGWAAQGGGGGHRQWHVPHQFRCHRKGPRDAPQAFPTTLQCQLRRWASRKLLHPRTCQGSTQKTVGCTAQPAITGGCQDPGPTTAFPWKAMCFSGNCQTPCYWCLPVR